MQIIKQILFIIMGLVAANLAQADSEDHYYERCYYRHGREVCVREWHSYHRCLEEIWEAQGTTVSVPECKVKTPLRRASTTKSYPLLGNRSYNVEYWQGSFEGTITETGRFLKKTYDTCHGRMVSREVVTDIRTRSEVFSISNPNLLDSVDTSYGLLPMVQEEAEAALAEAGARCGEMQ